MYTRRIKHVREADAQNIKLNYAATIYYESLTFYRIKRYIKLLFISCSILLPCSKIA